MCQFVESVTIKNNSKNTLSKLLKLSLLYFKYRNNEFGWKYKT